MRLPWWVSGKEPSCQCRRSVFHPWVGKIPWRRKCNLLQYSCLEDSRGRGARQVTVHGVMKELNMAYQLNNINIHSEILHYYREHGNKCHFFFHGSIIALQSYVRFCSTTKWISCGVHLSPPSWTSLLSLPLSHHSALGWAPCVISSTFPLAICFTCGREYVSVLLSQFVPPSLSPLCVHEHQFFCMRFFLPSSLLPCPVPFS